MVKNPSANSGALLAEEHSLMYDKFDMRAEFLKWLENKNARKYQPEIILSCIDEISEYVINKKISCSIWDVSKRSVYKPIYQKIIGTKLLRIMQRDAYKVFTVAGQLYAEFLKEKPWGMSIGSTKSTLDENGTEVIQENINEDDVVGWLITQPNVNGTFYKENVVRIYMSALRNAPQKLELNASQNRNVWSCHTVDELDELVAKFRAAPNYTDVNRTLWRGQLSAGLAVYRRYLEYIKNSASVICNVENTYTAKEGVESTESVIALEETEMLAAFSDIVDFEVGRDGLRNILDAHFQRFYGYSSNAILWDAAQSELSMFINDNAINTPKDLWNFVSRLFAREFVMTYGHIWQTTPNYPRNSHGLIINLARQCGGIVTRKQIDDYFACIKVNSPINAVVLGQRDLVFYDSDRFILTEILDLTNERCKSITEELSDLFICEKTPYIVPRDIRQEWFSRLPELVSGAWTALLLQEVLRIKPEIGYGIILPNLKGQKFDTLGAAIVPKNSDITSFADVVHCYCQARLKLPYDIQAEDLRQEIRTAGMVEGNELIYNMHKALHDYRFAFDSEKQKIKILEY